MVVRPVKAAAAKPVVKKGVSSGTDYAAIAKKRLTTPGQKPKRFLFYARNKKGKTRLVASAPNVLILDPEVGTDELDQEKFANRIWPINEWKDIDEFFKVYKSGYFDEVEWIAVDGMTRINNMALRYVMAQQEERDLDRIPGQVQQRDYGKAGELVKGMLFNFHALDVGIIYTVQERQETAGEFDGEDVDVEQAETRFVPDLPKGVRSSLNAIVNGIGRVYTVRLEDDDGNKKVERRLWMGQADAFDTGFRSQHDLPDYLRNPTIPKLLRVINTGKATR